MPAGGAGLWGKSMSIRSLVEPVHSEEPVSYPRGDAEQAIGYRNLAFKEGIGAGDSNFRVSGVSGKG